MLKNFSVSRIYSQRICVLVYCSVLGFSTTLMGNETVQRYYPVVPGSYWIYEDQDGRELTRYAATRWRASRDHIPQFPVRS